MCGGGGGGDTPLAQQAATQEQQRQARIQQGMADLHTMFEGGRRMTGPVGTGAAYDPNATYYDKGGNVWKPNQTAVTQLTQAGGPAGVATAGSGSWTGAASPENQSFQPSSVTPQSARPTDLLSRSAGLDTQWDQAQDATRQRTEQQALDEQLQGAIGGGLYTGYEDTPGYTSGFYDKAQQAQLDYALPQVDKQFQQAQRDLTYALARQGLGASSQGAKLQSDLEGRRNLAIQGEQDKARQVRNQQVSAVETERDNLTKMLQSSGDVASTMNAAAARKNVLDAAPAIQEVTPLFQNATGTLADMIVNPALRQAYGTPGQTGGYGSAVRGSGKVVA